MKAILLAQSGNSGGDGYTRPLFQSARPHPGERHTPVTHMVSVSDIVILAASSTLLAVAMARTDLSGSSIPTTTVVPTAYSTTDMNGVDVQEPPAVNTDQINTAALATDVVIEDPAGNTAENSSAFKEPAIIREATFNTHIVQSGEYLSLLAQRYNTTVSELKALNNLSSNTILVGQSIAYPTP